MSQRRRARSARNPLQSCAPTFAALGDEVRLRLLLDTVVDGAQGLRRELALPPVTEGPRPADLVAEDLAGGEDLAEGSDARHG